MPGTDENAPFNAIQPVPAVQSFRRELGETQKKMDAQDQQIFELRLRASQRDDVDVRRASNYDDAWQGLYYNSDGERASDADSPSHYHPRPGFTTPGTTFSDIGYLQEQLSRIEEEYKAEKTSHQSTYRDLEDAQKQLEDCELKLKRNESKHSKVLKKLEQLESSAKQNHREAESAKAQLDRQAGQLIELQREAIKLRAELTESEASLEAACDDRDAALNKIRPVNIQNKRLMQELEVQRKYAVEGTRAKALAESRQNTIDEQAKEIEELHRRLDAQRSIVETERNARLNGFERDLSMMRDGLSVPGYDLYKALVSQLENVVVSGDGPQKNWRELVLNEMNESLRATYSHLGKLERDREDFVGRYCEPIVRQNEAWKEKDRRRDPENQPSDTKSSSPSSGPIIRAV